MRLERIRLRGHVPMVGALEWGMIARSGGLWLLIRLVIALFAWIAGEHPLFLSPAAAVFVALVTVSLSWLATRGRFEDLMLSNLGTPPWVIAVLVSMPPLVCEVIVACVGTL
jgi:hypothetical protein